MDARADLHPIGGWSGLVIGFFALDRAALARHVHRQLGRARDGAPGVRDHDTSRNTLLVALATGGEGWHNNHHRYPWSARQGFRWWQIDVTYYVLRVLELDRHRSRSQARCRRRSSTKRAPPRLYVELRILLFRRIDERRRSTPGDPGGGKPNSSNSRGVDDSTNCVHAGCVAFDCTEWYPIQSLPATL